MAVSGVGSNVTTTVNDSLASTNKTSLADNFTTFLQLLTTQLKNQNPLDPLDTNQFTQQLVQFAQVEQQLKGNDQLASLVSLQQSAQSTQALGFVGHIVALDGQTSRLENGSAGWSFNSPKPATGTINIVNSRNMAPSAPPTITSMMILITANSSSLHSGKPGAESRC